MFWRTEHEGRWQYLYQEIRERWAYEQACMDRALNSTSPFDSEGWSYTWDRHNGGEVTWH